MERKKYLSNQKLWRIVNERNDYYYEIKLDGIVIDRLKIEEPAITYLEKVGLL